MLNIKDFEPIVLLTNSISSKSDLGKTMKQCVELEETAWLNQIRFGYSKLPLWHPSDKCVKLRNNAVKLEETS